MAETLDWYRAWWQQEGEAVVTARRQIPSAVPHLGGNEWKYVKECLDTNWVSSAGPFVERFERGDGRLRRRARTRSPSSTAAPRLHLALSAAGVRPDDGADAHADASSPPPAPSSTAGAHPVFLDVEPITWGLDPEKVADFLTRECEVRAGAVIDRGDRPPRERHGAGAPLRPSVRSRPAARDLSPLAAGHGGGRHRVAGRLLPGPAASARRLVRLPVVQRQQDHHVPAAVAWC